MTPSGDIAFNSRAGAAWMAFAAAAAQFAAAPSDNTARLAVRAHRRFLREFMPGGTMSAARVTINNDYAAQLRHAINLTAHRAPQAVA